ncbi:alpha-L-fucosidase [Mucilaginibacter koreensis]
MRYTIVVTTVVLLLNTLVGFAQTAPKPFGAVPSAAQLNWHEMEMYCLVHFGVDTYTNKEWGYGDEDPRLINPTKFNAAQIVGAAKAGGFKGVVIVAKHHDGLCLWPTKTTMHNISKSNWRGGKGDMIKEYRQACRQLGMQLGLYCSPWDRNSPLYGKPEYVSIYRKQLQELYSNYGKLFISWHDGANGGDGYYGGTREVRKIDRTTYYGWDTTWALVRRLQPSAVIFGDVGPDVRWVGNEEGHAGETSWATYDPVAPEAGHLPANGYTQYELGVEGTRNGKHWMPAECDVSLRPGWFYHASQNGKVKSPSQLLDLYYKSVGRGANLDLGLSPNPQGLLDDEDVNTLREFGRLLRETFAVNLTKGAKISTSNVRGNNAVKFGPQALLDDNRYSYWATDNQITTPKLTLQLSSTKTFNIIRLRENIKLGQRIEAFAVDAWQNGAWQQIAEATSIGANRLIRLPKPVTTRRVRLRILKSPVCIALSDFGLYREPVILTAPKISRDQQGLLNIITDLKEAIIHYTTDGSIPTAQSPVYHQPVSFQGGGMVKALVNLNGKQSSVVTLHFGLSKSAWKVVGDTSANAQKAIDEDAGTIWESKSFDTTAGALPADLIVDMGQSQSISAFVYLPRQDGQSAGVVDQYAFSVSTDGVNWKQVAQGEFSNIKANPVEQVVQLQQQVIARYFVLRAWHVLSGKDATAAEVGVISNR